MKELGTTICPHNTESSEIPYDPQLEPFIQTTERVIKKNKQLDQDFQDPIRNTAKNGLGKSWHWLSRPNESEWFTSTNLCMAIEPELREELEVNVRTTIKDKREEVDIEWINPKNILKWRLLDLQNKPELMERFEISISKSLSESFDDIQDKELIIFQYKKNLEKQIR